MNNRKIKARSTSSSSDSKRDNYHGKKDNSLLDEIYTHIKTFNNLINDTDWSQAKRNKILNSIDFLAKNRANIGVIVNGSNICMFCKEKFLQYENNCLPCFCQSVHKKCLLNECVKLSPSLEDNVLIRISCTFCKDSFGLDFIKNILNADYNNIKFKKIRCNICNFEKPWKEGIETDCKHSYCKDCIDTRFYNLIDGKKLDFKSFNCVVDNCGMKIYSEKFIKKNYENILKKYEDFILSGLDLFEGNKSIVYKCENLDCDRIMKHPTLKEKNYVCMSCEEKVNKEKNEIKNDDEN